jgi:hypothetical protein
LFVGVLGWLASRLFGVALLLFYIFYLPFPAGPSAALHACGVSYLGEGACFVLSVFCFIHLFLTAELNNSQSHFSAGACFAISTSFLTFYTA